MAAIINDVSDLESVLPGKVCVCVCVCKVCVCGSRARSLSRSRARSLFLCFVTISHCVYSQPK